MRLAALVALAVVGGGARASLAQPVAVDPPAGEGDVEGDPDGGVPYPVDDGAREPAHVVARPVEPEHHRMPVVDRGRHGHVGLGGGLMVGRVTASGLEDGWIVRLEGEAALLSAPGKLGGYLGYLVSAQLWGAGDDAGGGMPIAVELGVRAPGVRAGVLFGFEAFLVDEVADDTGVGFYAPLAGVRVATDWDGWSLGVDGRVERRWQIGADDHTQWQLGVTASYLWQRRLKEPYR